MKTLSSELMDYIDIDPHSSTPKYLQISLGIIDSIKNQRVGLYDLLPSINELSYFFDVSRDTVEKSYKHLKDIGVIDSVPSKGYFIRNTYLESNKRVLVLFNKLSMYKKIVYDSLAKALGPEATIDLYVYNNDFSLFKEVLTSQTINYAHFIIMPHLEEEIEGEMVELLHQIPKEKLLLLGKKLVGFEEECAVVYEDFGQDIYDALFALKEDLGKYHILKLVLPGQDCFPKEIKEGFLAYCADFRFCCEVVNHIERDEIIPGELYITISDEALMVLLEGMVSLGLVRGKDVGIISYNESPLKKFIMDGITTISADFSALGQIAAQLVHTGANQQVKVPFNLNRRKSI